MGLRLSGKWALALPMLISYGHTPRHFLPMLKTDVTVILPNSVVRASFVIIGAPLEGEVDI
jgi:hypothetical protein